MEPTARRETGGIRSSIDGLTDTAQTARSEIDHVGDSIRAALDQVTCITSEVPGYETTGLEGMPHNVLLLYALLLTSELIGSPQAPSLAAVFHQIDLERADRQA